jgi:starch synthase
MEGNKTIKVLYATGEAFPFSKTGGLADVAGSLPQSLKRKGVDCRIVTPLYGPVDSKIGKVSIDKTQMKYLEFIMVPVAWRREYCGIYEAEYDGVTYYLLDNERYFYRPTLFGEPDNAERFAFLSRAVLEILPYIHFKPDVIIANDWQTALTPIYQHIFYSQSDWFSGIKTAFTIHNIAYQGQFNFDILEDIFGLPQTARSIVEYNNEISLMKGAIETAHSVVTVSEGYAEEIAGNKRNPPWFDFGCGLTPIIKARYHKLTGILNGIGLGNDPLSDSNIYANYDVNTFAAGKAKNKSELQKRLELEERADIPLIGIVSRIDPGQKGCQLIVEALNEGLLDDNEAQFVLLGNAAEGDEDGKKIESAFKAIEKRYKGTGKIHTHIGFVPELSQKIYAGADMFLVPSLYEPCGLSQLIALKYGAIPVVRETGGLADTVEDYGNGKGTGFVFKDYSWEDLSHSIERAIEAYRDREAWAMLTKRAMECDYSWNKSSIDKYIELFERLLQ